MLASLAHSKYDFKNGCCNTNNYNTVNHFIKADLPVIQGLGSASASGKFLLLQPFYCRYAHSTV